MHCLASLVSAASMSVVSTAGIGCLLLMVCGVAIDPPYQRCGQLTVTHRLSLASCCCLASEVTTHSNTPLSTWFATLLPALAQKILTPKLFFLGLYLGFWVWRKGEGSCIKRCLGGSLLLKIMLCILDPLKLFLKGKIMPRTVLLINFWSTCSLQNLLWEKLKYLWGREEAR